MKNLVRVSKMSAFAAMLCTAVWAQAETAVEVHGALHTKGNKILDSHNKPASFAGPSLFWSNSPTDDYVDKQWREDRYYNADVVAYVQKNWNASIIRAAIGADPHGGYAADPEGNFARAKAVIDAAIAQGMYVIVDWHSHMAHKDPDLAIQFFERIATEYGNTPNVIYEIYNEPLNTADWSTVIKPYAEKVIAKIRAIDPDNLIIVGTQTWSQDVDKAAKDPIKDYDNIAYALHFYAGTHKEYLRKKAEKALRAGIPLFVSEWGTVNANGDGGIDKKESKLWLKFMHKHHLSFCIWALSDKTEGASQLKLGTVPDGKWSDANLTEEGLYVKDILLHWDRKKYTGAKETSQ